MSQVQTSDWSETAASNSQSPPAGWPEGQNPSSVNDCAREMMSALKIWWNRDHPTISSATSTTAFTLTYTTAPTAYAQGLMFAFKVHSSSTGSVTLNVNALGAKKVYRNISGTATQVASGEWQANDIIIVSYDTSLDTAAGGFWWVNAPATGVSPTVPGLSGSSFPITPQGRLTLTSATPVMTSTTSAQTTIYYTPYVGGLVPIYDGTRWTITPFTELSQATTDSTKSPAAVANNSVYDLFVWSDSGTLRCTRGPAWSNDTTRGYTLTMQNGILLNTSTITNGPGASRGTWVGTVRSNGSAQIDWIYGARAASGTAAFFGLWNAYNRVNVATMVQDTTDSWTLASSSIRSANNSTTMRCTMVRGANEDAIFALYSCAMSPSASGSAQVGVGIDSTSAFSGWMSYAQTGTLVAAPGGYMGLPGLGVHYVQALESSQNAGTQTFYGDNAVPTYMQNGLSVQLRA